MHTPHTHPSGTAAAATEAAAAGAADGIGQGVDTGGGAEHPDDMPQPRSWLRFLTEVLQIGLVARLAVAGLWLMQGKSLQQRVVLGSLLLLYYLYSVGIFDTLMDAFAPRQLPRVAAGAGAAAGAAAGAGAMQGGGIGVDAADNEEQQEAARMAYWHQQGLMYDLFLPLAAFVLSLSPEWRNPEPLPQSETAEDPAQQEAEATELEQTEQAMPAAEDQGEAQDGAAGAAGGDTLQRRQPAEEGGAGPAADQVA